MIEALTGNLERTAQRWLVQLQSGRMTEHELAELRSWLGADRAHRRAFEEVRAVWRGLEPLQAKYSQPPETEVGQAPLARAVQAQSRRRRSLAYVGAALAAGVAVLAVFTGALTRMRADYATSIGEVSQVKLPDGSFATLDSDSAIAVHYAPGERRIDLLKGEAWFDVEKNPRRPFRVHAQGGVAEAVGTAFAVRSVGDRVSVLVTHGNVAVSSDDSRRDGTPLHVLANEQTSFTFAQPPDAVTTFAPATSLSWRTGRLVFDEAPLAEVVAVLERYRPGWIVLLDQARADVRVSGVFLLSDLDQALKGFAVAQNLQVTHVTPYLVFLRAGERGE